LLDSTADIAFVLIALAAGVLTGRLSWAVPASIMCAAAPYLVTMIRQRSAAGPTARSAIGHAAGVFNYALAGLLAGSVAFPWPGWPLLLELGSAVVIALNLGAVVQRLRQRRPRTS